MLLHFSSLPGAYREGLLGQDVTRFLDFLVDAGFSAWQMLPVQPVEHKGSPYQASSAHAGNPDFISLDGAQATAAGPDEAYRRYIAAAGQPAYEEFLALHAVWLEGSGA